tara:strand:- start:21 stop:935 length:915 start_codon:yes stop_codon:yes gene_type:complete
MDDNDSNFPDPSIPLILKREINFRDNKNNLMLRIRDLIDKRYLTINKDKLLNIKNSLNNDFTYIKDSAKVINDNVKEKTLSLSSIIENKENELNLLHLQKRLLDKNKIQSQIIDNQQKLIQSYKKDNNEFKIKLTELHQNLKESMEKNRLFEINNTELKNTILKHIDNNKKLNDTIDKLESIQSQNKLTPEQINELKDKVKFYQEENIRLSSELNSVQNNYKRIKDNFAKLEHEKNNIYRQIQELNNSLIKNNVVGTPFVKEIIEEDSINSKVLNDISNKNLDEENEKSNEKNKLDDNINDIFN